MSTEGNGERPKLHPAEHRGYRELAVAGRQLLARWSRLAEAVSDTGVAPVLDEAAGNVREMLDELSPRIAAYDLHAGRAVHGVGSTVGDVRGAVIDRSFDTGVAVRFAVLDIEHITTLLAHLSGLAEARDDWDLAKFDADWQRRLRPQVKSVRKAAVDLGRDPDRVAQPLDSSRFGQVAHRAGWAIGTLGEWFDRRSAKAPSEETEQPQD
jgi:hypothetical protein